MLLLYDTFDFLDYSKQDNIFQYKDKNNNIYIEKTKVAVWMSEIGINKHQVR